VRDVGAGSVRLAASGIPDARDDDGLEGFEKILAAVEPGEAFDHRADLVAQLGLIEITLANALSALVMSSVLVWMRAETA